MSMRDETDYAANYMQVDDDGKTISSTYQLKTNFQQVGQFMEAFKQPVNVEPEIPSVEVEQLRYDLIAEELEELHHAMKEENIIEIADALTDLLYVVYGAGHTYGIDLDKCFNEVHRSNMSKLGANGEPIFREDGKVLKGPNYSPPELGKIVFGNLEYSGVVAKKNLDNGQVELEVVDQNGVRSYIVVDEEEA